MTNIEVAWCAQVKERLLREGFGAADPHYPPSYRTNQRWVADDPALAAELAARLDLPDEHIDEAGRRWRLTGLNPRMRACRYRPGEWFGIHRDGVHWASQCERSFFSVVVYLDDAFAGGETRFFADRRGAVVTRVVRPAVGRALVFDHREWHEGSAVSAGIKHVLRTDVMYTRAEADEIRGHLGYVWCLAAEGSWLVSGGRDRTLRVWSGDALRSTTVAHEASVTCVAARGGGRWVSGSRDRTLAWWRSSPGGALHLERRAPAHEGAVLAVAVLSEERTASAGADGVVALHDDRGVIAREARHDSWVWALASLPSGGVASAGEDGRVVIGARAFDLGVPQRALVARPDGCVVAGGADGVVRTIDPRAGVIAERVAHEGPITCLALDADGAVLSGGEDDRAVRDGPRAHEVRHRDFVRAVVGLPDGSFASAGYDGVIRRGEAYAAP